MDYLKWNVYKSPVMGDWVAFPPRYKPGVIAYFNSQPEAFTYALRSANGYR